MTSSHTRFNLNTQNQEQNDQNRNAVRRDRRCSSQLSILCQRQTLLFTQHNMSTHKTENRRHNAWCWLAWHRRTLAATSQYRTRKKVCPPVPPFRCCLRPYRFLLTAGTAQTVTRRTSRYSAVNETVMRFQLDLNHAMPPSPLQCVQTDKTTATKNRLCCEPKSQAKVFEPKLGYFTQCMTFVLIFRVELPEVGCTTSGTHG